MSDSGGEWQVKQIMYAAHTALLAGEECKFQILVGEFRRVCKRSKLFVNVAKSKVMRVTKRENNIVDIDITLNGIGMEEVNCFRYLGIDIDIHGVMKSEMKHRVTGGEKIGGVLTKT
jgi:hypothetical protein